MVGIPALNFWTEHLSLNFFQFRFGRKKKGPGKSNISSEHGDEEQHCDWRREWDEESHGQHCDVPPQATGIKAPPADHTHTRTPHFHNKRHSLCVKRRMSEIFLRLWTRCTCANCCSVLRVCMAAAVSLHPFTSEII